MSTPARALSALRTDPDHPRPETEPVLLERDGNDLVITLDDGLELRLDAHEARTAVDDLADAA